LTFSHTRPPGVLTWNFDCPFSEESADAKAVAEKMKFAGARAM